MAGLHDNPPSLAAPTVPLDSLFSPQAATFQGNGGPAVRDSITSDFGEVSLEDEVGFSSVALSSSQSVFTAVPSSLSKETRPRSSSLTSMLPPSVQGLKVDTGHKKSASTTTIRSGSPLTVRTGSPLPFIIAQVAPPQERDTETTATTNRSSLDGQHQIQEEFARLQLQKDKDEREDRAQEIIDWDFWGAVISDYTKFASENGERLAEAISSGIPATLRGMMWQLMAASKDPDLESQYLRLLKEPSPHEKAIHRDLGRTFPHHAFFKDGQGIGQENLFNVLKAYSLYDPQVGYCQGLPFVVAILLLNMPDEEAFSLLVRLMHVYDLRGHFLPEMPRLQVRLYQFDRLLEEMLPVLHIHFLRQGVKSSMFCSQWFLTMFSYRFPLDIVFRIYDNCFASGIEAIFGFSIMLLLKNEDLLLKLKFEDIMAFLNTKLFDRYTEERKPSGDTGVQFKVDEFVKDAVSLRITPFMLDSYSREYEDIKRETNKHNIELDQLRASNRALNSQVKNLETAIGQMSSEHVELLNELVKARLRNEEMEGELVRYKLLYAEAVHKNEDANSNQRISSNSITQLLSFRR